MITSAKDPLLAFKLRSAIAALSLTFLLFTFISLSIGIVAVTSHDLVMDKYIDGRFERLEKALANLIDSVTKYHPSIQQGEELNAADQELSRGLEEGNSYNLASHEYLANLILSPNPPEQLFAYSTTARGVKRP